MKRLAILTVSATLAISGAVSFFAAPAAQQKKAANMPPLLNLLQGLYINNLQQNLELTDEQFPKVAAFLKDFVRDSFDIEVPRKNRAINQLRQAVLRGTVTLTGGVRSATEEDLSRLSKEYDQIYADDHAVREKFFANVDPILQVSQRAKLRFYIFQKEHPRSTATMFRRS